MDKDTEIVRTSLRMHKRLYDRLDGAARARGLTMHAEILARLEDSFEHEAKATLIESRLDAIEARIKELKQEGKV